MFKNTSDEFKHQLVKELVAFETQNVPPVNNNESMTTAPYGYVHYRVGEAAGKIDLEIGFKGHGNALVRYKSGKIAIVIHNVDFVIKNFSEIQTIIAHELGHYLSGHFNGTDSAYLSMYESESAEAISNNDQAQHIYWSARSVADGGYIVREMQADTIAAHIVGIDRVFHMQMTDAFDHDNLTVAIEKLNRLKHLYAVFKGVETPTEGYYMSIEYVKPSQAEDPGV